MPLVPMPLPQIRLSKSMYFWALLSSSAAAVLSTWHLEGWCSALCVLESLGTAQKKCNLYQSLHSRYFLWLLCHQRHGWSSWMKFIGLPEANFNWLPIRSYSVGNFSRWVVVLGQRKMCRRDSESREKRDCSFITSSIIIRSLDMMWPSHMGIE